MISWASLTTFLYLMTRISGFVLLSPILGRKTIPGIVRGGMILVLSVFIYPVMDGRPVEVPGGAAVFAVHILLELLLGFFLGMAVHFFLYIPHLAGLMVDTQMGMTMNQIYDAGAESNLSVSGQLLNVLMLLLFFAANGHHTLIRIILTS